MMTSRTLPERSFHVSISRRSARALTAWTLALTVCSLGLAVFSVGDTVKGASRAATQHADAQLSQRLVGRWKTRAWGEQVLTNHPDGTASLDVALNRLAAIRYGRELELQLEWTVENGILSHNLVGGSPQRSVDRLIRDFGASSEYRVVGVTETALVLEEIDEPGKQHVWEPVEDDDA